MFQLPGFRPQATPSYVPITGFLALVLCSGLSANLKERIYPGIDPPTRIASFRSLALSVSDSGVLALSRNPGGRNDLTYHFGENFAQVLTILTNRQALVLSGKGFVQGNKTFFALILDNKPYLLSIDEATRSFDLEEIDSEEKYFNSDLLVTDEGETWILVYDTALFQPRLARKTGNQAFEFIDLGLEGVYLDFIYGTPRMRLVPGVLEGKLYFWVTRQFTSAANQLVLVAVDLDSLPFSADAELSAAGSGSAPISTPAEEDAVEESVADELTPPEKQTFGEDDDTSAFLVKAAQELSGIIGSQPGLLYMDDGWIKASLHFPNDKSFANFNIDRKGPGFQAVSAANGPQGFATLRYYNDNISRLILELEGDGSGDVEMRDTAYFARDRFTIGDTDFVGMRVDETGQGTLFGNSTRDNMFSAAPFYLGNTQVIPQIIVGGSDLFVSNLDTVLGIVSVEAFSSSGDKLLGEEVSLDPKETKQFEVPGPFGAGYVLLRSPLEFASQIRWNTKALLDIPDVGMPGEKGGSSWNFIAFNDSKIRTGVAMANPGGQKDCVATYDDKEHEILFRVDFTLGLGRSLPIFLEELLPGLADAGDTTGLFGVSCTGMDLNPTDDLIPAGAGRAPSGDDLFSATAVTQERESNAIVATPGFPADILGFSKIIRILTPDDPL